MPSYEFNEPIVLLLSCHVMLFILWWNFI